MRPLSATECITPAIERTKLILFSPFRKGRTWKLCAAAYLTIVGMLYVPPLVYLCFFPLVWRLGKLASVLFCIAIVLVTVLFTWIFHLCSRLQFAYFDIVVNHGEFVAPAWRKYRAQALPWTSIKILVGSILTLLCAAPLAAFLRRLIPLFASTHITPGQPPPQQFMTMMAGLYMAYFAFGFGIGVVYLAGSTLTNFMLPSLALENTGIKVAFHRMVELVRREPGEFTIFVLLKAGLGIAAYMGAVILWEIVFLLCTLILGVIVVLLGFLLHHAGVSPIVLAVPGILLAIAWYLFSTIYLLFLAIGPAWTFLDAYALYFLGGRYPMLGDLLDRSTPPRPTAPYPPPVVCQAYTPQPPPA